MSDKRRDEEEPEFKVVDRRLFTSEGEKREGSEPHQPESASTPTPPQQPVPPPPPRGEAQSDQVKTRPAPESQADEKSGPRPGAPGGPASFEQLVMSLATTAMFQMGLVRNPGEQQPPRVDLAGAKESIDLLDILQKKTAGNLTEEEAGLLEGSIYELRMVFVELSKGGRVR